MPSITQIIQEHIKIKLLSRKLTHLFNVNISCMVAGGMFFSSSFISAYGQEATQSLSFIKAELNFENPVVGPSGVLRVLKSDSDSLIVHTRDDASRNIIHLYNRTGLSEGQNNPDHSISIPRNAIFYSHGEMPDGVQEKFLILTEKGVDQYDPVAQKFITVVESPSIFRQGVDFLFARSGFAQDLNDDERFDLLIPDFDGMRVFMQNASGGFAEPFVLPVQPEMRLTRAFSNDNVSDTEFSIPAARTPTFKVFPSYVFDATGDQKSDIVFIVGRQFHIFEQQGGSETSFALQPKIVEFAFQARGNRWQDDILAGERNVDQSNFSDTTLYRLVDLDEDDIMDVVTVTNKATGLLDRAQDFFVYYGSTQNGLIHYNAEPDYTYSLEGVGGVGFRDVNNDGRRDFVVTTVKLSLGKIISFLVSRKVKTSIKVFLNSEDGKFIEEKSFRRNVSIGVNLSRGQTENPPIEYSDFDGDGALDLLIGDRGKDVDILSYKSGEGFDEKIANLAAQFPTEGYLLDAYDVNEDEKSDVVIRYSRFGLDGEAAKRKMVLFLSK